LFPDGRPPSRIWRFVPALAIGAPLAVTVGSILNPGVLDIDPGISVTNPTGVASLEWLAHGLLWVGGVGLLVVAIGSIVALVQRFRRAMGEERQQIRWLTSVAAVAGIMLVLAIVSGIGLRADQTRLVNDIGIGVPSAIGVAVLRYRLWELDVVVKKTIVAAIVVVLITAVALVFLAVAGGAVVGPLSDSPEATLAAGVAVGVLFWPLRKIARRIADRLVYGGRATPYEVLSEFSDRMAETYSTDDVLPRMAGIVGAGTGAERVDIWLLVGREMLPAATWPPGELDEQARPMTSMAEVDPGAFEVRHQGEPLGAITVRMPANDPMNPGKEKLIRDLASQAGLVLRKVRLIEELRASRRRLVAAQDAERRRVERNIHDGAQQQLVALAVKLRLADQVVERDPGKARELLDQLQAQAHETLEDLRDLARGIYPPLLADEGLAAALGAQGRKVPVPVEVRPDGIGRYEQEVEAAVYFCVLEALQNVTKYARATRVDVTLEDDGHGLAFRVWDDGVGFDRTSPTRGTGLQGMADRLDAVGGSLEVRSEPGQGTAVVGRVPVR
jgi:signal transduction histidine kinase